MPPGQGSGRLLSPHQASYTTTTDPRSCRTAEAEAANQPPAGCMGTRARQSRSGPRPAAADGGVGGLPTPLPIEEMAGRRMHARTECVTSCWASDCHEHSTCLTGGRVVETTWHLLLPAPAHWWLQQPLEYTVGGCCSSGSAAALLSVLTLPFCRVLV